MPKGTRISSYQIRHIILQQSKRAGVGHIGSGLSVADLIAVLYDHVLHIPHPDDPERDRFVMSKGHAALALYAALFLKGWITEEQLNTFCADGSMLGVHPARGLPGVDFSTGSLGMGLSFGAGCALAAKLQHSSRRAFVLMSDGECNEGSVWEAAMFAAHHQLSNLVAIVDLNGQQALGYTADVLDLTPMGSHWQAFGWDVHDVDGHDVVQMAAVLDSFNTAEGRPHALIAHTVFGKGVSFMEGQIKWHYSPLSDEEYDRALAELGDGS
ncbi:MAG: transketolase [Anaerolineales bacterium]|jgi:transketolase